MPKSHRSSGLIATGVQLAKKMGATGLNLFNHAAPDSVSKLNQAPEQEHVIEGQAQEKSTLKQQGSDKKHYERPQQMMREHIPQLSSQLLGRHYQKVNHIASFIAPDFNDRISDYLFEHLNDAVSQLSSCTGLLKEVGAKSLDELAKDPERSARISMALSNQNKFWAAAQGGVSGVAGVFGAALDVPFSIALALRGIYQTGRAYGFELNSEDHNVVEYIFKQIDLSSVAEKQAVLAVIRSVSQMLNNQDMQQLQQLLGSSNNPEYLLKWLQDEQGQAKWAWLKQIPQPRFLSKLAPLASAGVGASYSIKLVNQATTQAEHVFSQARQYLLQHPTLELDPLSAYEQSQVLIAGASPLLQAPIQAPDQQAIRAGNDVDVNDVTEPAQARSKAPENDVIIDVELTEKPSQDPVASDDAQAEQELAQKIHQELSDLAQENIHATAEQAQTSVVTQAAKTDDSVTQSAASITETSANEKKSTENSSLAQENQPTTTVENQPTQTQTQGKAAQSATPKSATASSKKSSKSPRSQAKRSENAAQKNTQSDTQSHKK